MFTHMHSGGSISPDEGMKPQRRNVVLPCLLELKACLDQAHATVAELNPVYKDILQLPGVQNTAHPAKSCLAIYTQHLQVLNLKNVAADSRAQRLLVTAYAFDNVYVSGDSMEHATAAFHTVAAAQLRSRGMRLALKSADGRALASGSDNPSRVVAKRSHSLHPAPKRVGLAGVLSSPARKIQRSGEGGAADDDSDLDIVGVRQDFYGFEMPSEAVLILCDLHETGLHCVLWGCVALVPQLATVQEVKQCSKRQGPYTYSNIEEKIISLTIMVPARPAEVFQTPGVLLGVC